MDDRPAVILRAPRLSDAGFVHGFSTRHHGASDGPFATLNLGAMVGDRPEAVAENHRRLAVAIGYDPQRLYLTSQVHGAGVYLPQEDERPEEVRRMEADALVARTASMAVGVRVADCVPVLLADPVTGTVAAVHAGWRGIVRGVLREAVRALGAGGAGGAGGMFLAAIGPSIGPCCFEVGDDVAADLGEAGGDGIVIRQGNNRPHVDLWRAVEHQLRAAGVATVDTLGHCTACEPGRFFSFRRDGARSGRMLAVIVAR